MAYFDDNVVADTTHYLENECMREAMETLLYENGVDVILNGHLHEYERTNPVYVSPPLQRDSCSVVIEQCLFSSCVFALQMVWYRLIAYYSTSACSKKGKTKLHVLLHVQSAR